MRVTFMSPSPKSCSQFMVEVESGAGRRMKDDRRAGGRAGQELADALSDLWKHRKEEGETVRESKMAAEERGDGRETSRGNRGAHSALWKREWRQIGRAARRERV